MRPLYSPREGLLPCLCVLYSKANSAAADKGPFAASAIARSMAPRVALAAALLVLNAAAAAAAAARPAAPAPPSLRFNNLAPAHEAPRDEDAELELLQFPPLALLNNGEGGGDHTDPDAVTPNEDADFEYCCRTCKERIRVRSALRSTRSVPRLRPSTVRCLSTSLLWSGGEADMIRGRGGDDDDYNDPDCCTGNNR